MQTKDTPEHVMERRRLEWMLVVITLGLICLLNMTVASKAVVLNLFYLPVVCAGFFLGRYRAGALAFFSVIAVSVIMMSDVSGFAISNDPVTVLLTLCIWGSVLGLTAVFVGTLSDDRQTKTNEAREAYLGVVEVLSSYLQAVNPKLQYRARRVAELSEKVGRKLRMSDQELDNIRLAALMLDMESLEITSRVIRKAVDEIEEGSGPRTFPGSELVQSLGRVLTGVVQADDFSGRQRDQSRPLSAEVIRTVRAYLHLIQRPLPAQHGNEFDPFAELETDDVLSVPSAVIDALRAAVHDERNDQVLSVISATGSHRFAGVN
jgi:K+-sensing histidine kinase KdpD